MGEMPSWTGFPLDSTLFSIIVIPFKFQFVLVILRKPCTFKALCLLNAQILYMFPYSCPYNPKQGNLFIRMLNYFSEDNRLSAYESEIHPSHKPAVCSQCISFIGQPAKPPVFALIYLFLDQKTHPRFREHYH